MKYVVFLVLFNAAQYACKSNETQIFDSKISPWNLLNITTNKRNGDINECQQPSFANYTIGNKRFISIDDDTFKEYLKTVDLTVYDGLLEYHQFKNWTPPEQMINDFPWYLSGYDPENRPIIVTEVGKFQFVKYALGGREMQAMVVKLGQYRAYQFLKAMAFKSTTENPVHQYIEIVDYEGLKPEFVLTPSVLKLCLKLFNSCKKFMFKYTYKLVVLNVNQIVEIFFNAMRAFNVLRRDKTHVIYGTNREFWVPKIVKMFGKYQLSGKYGGCEGFLPTYIV